MDKYKRSPSSLLYHLAAIPQFLTDNRSSQEDWQFERPVWNTNLCIRCGACYLTCPDAAIHKNDEGYFHADVRRCKGCGLCVRECWTGAISLEQTAQRPPWLTKLY